MERGRKWVSNSYFPNPFIKSHLLQLILFSLPGTLPSHDLLWETLVDLISLPCPTAGKKPTTPLSSVPPLLLHKHNERHVIYLMLPSRVECKLHKAYLTETCALSRCLINVCWSDSNCSPGKMRGILITPVQLHFLTSDFETEAKGLSTALPWPGSESWSKSSSPCLSFLGE